MLGGISPAQNITKSVLNLVELESDDLLHMEKSLECTLNLERWLPDLNPVWRDQIQLCAEEMELDIYGLAAYQLNYELAYVTGEPHWAQNVTYACPLWKIDEDHQPFMSNTVVSVHSGLPLIKIHTRGHSVQFALPGQVGCLQGKNLEAGFGLAVQALPQSDLNSKGLPITWIAREVLEAAQSYEQALQMLERSSVYAGGQINVFSKDRCCAMLMEISGNTKVLETTSKETFVSVPKIYGYDKWHARAESNHVDPVHIEKIKAAVIKQKAHPEGVQVYSFRGAS